MCYATTRSVNAKQQQSETKDERDEEKCMYVCVTAVYERIRHTSV